VASIRHLLGNKSAPLIYTGSIPGKAHQNPSGRSGPKPSQMGSCIPLILNMTASALPFAFHRDLKILSDLPIKLAKRSHRQPTTHTDSRSPHPSIHLYACLQSGQTMARPKLMLHEHLMYSPPNPMIAVSRHLTHNSARDSPLMMLLTQKQMGS
jgi:hypothetical protein